MHEATVLLNRYRLERLLGRGGMADVYLAFDLRRQAHIAVKVLREDLAEDPDFVRRFQREAEALARLDHPYIVRFYSFERQATTAFIAMDYVPGTTLRGRLTETHGPLPLDEVTGIVRQVGAALQYAHNQGFLHRDIKPGNIMLREDGTALLSDFGIARAAETATMTSGPLGTPAYMSPEQILGRDLDPRTDIYSLGVVMFEMATGRRPYSGETGTGSSTADRVRDAHLHQQAPDPRSYNRSLPDATAQVISRALAKDPAHRWSSAAALVAAWERALGMAPQAGPEAYAQPAATPSLAQVPSLPVAQWPQGQTATPQAPPPARVAGHSNWMLWAIIGVTLALLACIGIFGYQALAGTPTRNEATTAAVAQQTANAQSERTAVALAAEWSTATALAPGTDAPATATAEPVPTAAGQDAGATATAESQLAAATGAWATAAADMALREADVSAKETADIVAKLTSEAVGLAEQATATAVALAQEQAAVAEKQTAEAQAAADAQDNADAQATADAQAKAVAMTSEAATAAAKPAQAGVIADFERDMGWRRGNEPNGDLTTSSEQVHSGSHSGKLTYEFPASANNYVVFLARPSVALGGKPSGIAAWVYGDGSDNFLNVWIQDSAGEIRQYTFGQIGHTGWAQMTAAFNEGLGWPNGNVSGPETDNGALDYPVSFYAIVLDGIHEDQPSKGAIYLDDITALP